MLSSGDGNGPGQSAGGSVPGAGTSGDAVALGTPAPGGTGVLSGNLSTDIGSAAISISGVVSGDSSTHAAPSSSSITPLIEEGIQAIKQDTGVKANEEEQEALEETAIPPEEEAHVRQFFEIMQRLREEEASPRPSISDEDDDPGPQGPVTDVNDGITAGGPAGNAGPDTSSPAPSDGPTGVSGESGVW